MSLTIVLPLPPSALTGNQRGKRGGKHSGKGGEWAIAARYREDCRMVARAQANYPGEPLIAEPVMMRLLFVVPTSDRRDLTGLIECVKPGIDGLVDAKVLSNDAKSVISEISGVSWRYAEEREGPHVSITFIRRGADAPQE